MGKTLKEKITEAEKKQQKKDSEKKVRHRGLCEDCEFYRVPRTDGKSGFKTISVYMGVMYECELSDSDKLRFRIKFSALYFLLLVVFFVLVCINSAVNKSWVAIFEGISFVGMVYVLAEWVINVTAEKQMRTYLYRLVHERLVRSCEITMVFTTCTVAASVIYIFVDMKNWLASLLNPIGFALLTVGLRLLADMEAKVPYKSWKSKETAPKNGERLNYEKSKKSS